MKRNVDYQTNLKYKKMLTVIKNKKIKNNSTNVDEYMVFTLYMAPNNKKMYFFVDGRGTWRV